LGKANEVIYALILEEKKERPSWFKSTYYNERLKRGRDLVLFFTGFKTGAKGEEGGNIAGIVSILRESQKSDNK